MRAKLTASLVVLALAASSALRPLPVSAQETFSKTQINEMHNVIREYLLENPSIIVL